MVKKTLTLLTAFVIVLSTVVFAQEEVQAGITPDSIWYGLDRAIERLTLLFTTNPSERARLHLQNVAERLSEIKETIAQRKFEAMQRAEIERQNELNEMENELPKMPEEVRAHVLEMLQKHITRLNEVKENAPVEAIKGLETAIERSGKVLERFQPPLTISGYMGRGGYKGR